MTVTILPGKGSGRVNAPPSKSMAHRLLICAGLASGESRIRRVAFSQDIQATLDCLRALGADGKITEDTVTLRGCNPVNAPDGSVLPCRECGSTLRFLIPLCLLSGRELLLTGSDTLLRRPLSVYEEICQSQGLIFENKGSILRVQGKLTPGKYEIPGDISSQFVSGLLFALPLLEGDSEIHLRPPVESRNYIDMTIAALEMFGIRVQWQNETGISIFGNQQYQSGNAVVEGDWSNGAALIALGGEVTGLNADSLQGDKVYVEYKNSLLEHPARPLDLSNCPDLGPLLMAEAALYQGGVFTGTRRLRMKESDRGEAMRMELAKFGVDVAIEDNRIVIGHGIRPPTAILDSHNDHRIVMAMTVLCTHTGGKIQGAEAVGKSFPDFFDRLQNLGIGVYADGMD